MDNSKHTVNYNIENLVLSGGGLKGIAYIGCLRILEKVNLMKQIKRVIGTSTGSIFGLFFILGYTSSQIQEIIIHLNMNNIVDISADNLLSFPFNYGIDTGNKIKKMLSVFIKKKVGKSDITFKEFYDFNKIEFTITGTCLTDYTCNYFNYKNTPDMKLIDALRISYSYPIIFNKVQYNDKLFVDGCVLNNFPIEYFSNYESSKTLGLYICGDTKNSNGFFNYVHCIFNLAIENSEKQKVEKYKSNILILNVNLNNITNINKEDILDMIKIGEKQMEIYLKKIIIRIKQKEMEKKLQDNIESMKKTKDLDEIISLDSTFTIESFSNLNEEIMELLDQLS